VYSPAQTTTLLGGWGNRGEITAGPKSFVPPCSPLQETQLIGSESLLLEKRRNMAAFEWSSIHNKQI